jgi:Domain of unknown function (DUF4189)
MFVVKIKRSVVMLAGAIAFVFVTQASPARADCANGLYACPTNTGGGCAPVGTVCCPGNTHAPLGAACPNEESGDWGAIAVVTWGDSGGEHVESGVASGYKTVSQASTAAMLDCQKASVQMCQMASVFANGGCGYVSVGQTSKGVKWAVDDSAQAAVNDCTANGGTCKPAVGSCTKK